MDKPSVALLQRSIAHYRFPLFKNLALESPFAWTFYCSDHNEKVSTGLPAPDLQPLNIRPTRNIPVYGPFLWQSGVQLGSDGLSAFMLDLGWTILSTPRYLLEAKARGIAVIGWSKGIPQDPTRPETLAKRTYQKFLLSLCDTLVTYGKISRDYFVDRGFPAKRIFIAQNTIDTARIAGELSVALEQKQKLSEKLKLKDRFIFGYLGGLVPRKKVESIIEAFGNVRRRGLDAVLIIAGGGSSETSVKSAAVQSGFQSDILITGRVPIGEEGGFFQIFDAFISYAQGGLGILEAMAHGRAIISTPEKYPETELLVDKETALLTRDSSVEALADRMSFAVLHKESLSEIGAKAQTRVLNEATLEKMAESINCAVAAAIRRKTGA